MSVPTLQPVAHIDDIPVGEGRAFTVDGRQVAVFRLRNGTVRAVDAMCPHRQGPLADGLVDDCVVVCPLHAFSYDLATGRETSMGGEPVAVHGVTVRDDGTVSVSLDG